MRRRLLTLESLGHGPEQVIRSNAPQTAQTPDRPETYVSPAAKRPRRLRPGLAGRQYWLRRLEPGTPSTARFLCSHALYSFLFTLHQQRREVTSESASDLLWETCTFESAGRVGGQPPGLPDTQPKHAAQTPLRSGPKLASGWQRGLSTPLRGVNPDSEMDSAAWPKRNFLSPNALPPGGGLPRTRDRPAVRRGSAPCGFSARPNPA